MRLLIAFQGNTAIVEDVVKPLIRQIERLDVEIYTRWLEETPPVELPEYDLLALICATEHGELPERIGQHLERLPNGRARGYFVFLYRDTAGAGKELMDRLAERDYTLLGQRVVASLNEAEPGYFRQGERRVHRAALEWSQRVEAVLIGLLGGVSPSLYQVAPPLALPSSLQGWFWHATHRLYPGALLNRMRGYRLSV